MLAIHAAAPISMAPILLDGARCLRAQARRDARGQTHGDGWGFGFHPAAAPTRARSIRGDAAAWADGRFAMAAESIRGCLAMAHVRQASVGSIRLENTHPFTLGRWAFAHNGTLTGFEKLADRIRDETDPAFRMERKGDTDSEAAFYWMLSRLRDAGQSLEEPVADRERWFDVLGSAMRELSARCLAAAPREQPRLNFIFTDGKNLAATRWEHGLHYRVFPEGFRDAPVDQRTRAVVIASEPLTDDNDWLEVPSLGVIVVDASLELVTRVVQ